MELLIAQTGSRHGAETTRARSIRCSERDPVDAPAEPNTGVGFHSGSGLAANNGQGA
jgi:hypothetical protein